MINLLNAIVDLERQRKALAEKHTAEMKDMDDAISFLRFQNQACWYCRGKGKLLRADRQDENDPANWSTCPSCRGTGVKHWDSDEGKMTIDTTTGRAICVSRTGVCDESHSYLATMK